MTTLASWKGATVRVVSPGHPEDGQTGWVLGVMRANARYRQRAKVVIDGAVYIIAIDGLERAR